MTVAGMGPGPGFEGRAPEPGQLVPATGAWLESDPVGHRQFHRVGPFRPERGGLVDVTIAYETWGKLNAAGDNAVLVLHALTGDSHIRGPAGPGHPTAGWWTDLIGPGAPVDTDEYFVLAPNVLGGCQGTTGPASLSEPSWLAGPEPSGRPGQPVAPGRPVTPGGTVTPGQPVAPGSGEVSTSVPDAVRPRRYGSSFAYITVRDQVRAELALADFLGIRQFALVIGGSMGGMRVLEWAVMAPDRVARIAPVATTAKSTADQIAWAHAQLCAIRNDPYFLGGDYYGQPDGQGPHVGLGIARQIAHTTYRSAVELEGRFGAEAQAGEEPLGGGGRYAVASYLEHHAAKLALRFDANSYIVLTEALCSHDVGRDRGGVAAALASISARALVVAVDSDRLYLPRESGELADLIPGAGDVHLVHSDYGHDGFLIEFAQLGPVVGDFLHS
ncbi:MAG: homoserine O-acetyltransferase [Bifidobacteriaceae bacterium]|jgi:homoserine O-acetyltransferase|nr:homoserine O-acetyltransferase [Bifidobacteriaceae bacterium]